MSATAEKIKALVSTLQRAEREELLDELLEGNSTELLDSDREQIEGTLQDRMKGPFTMVEDPDQYLDEMKESFRKKTEALMKADA